VAKVRAVGLLLTAAYLAFVGWLLLRPHYVAWVPAPNLSPLDTIRADLRMGPEQAVRRIGEGLALLAPLGVLLPVAGGRVRTSGPASFVRTVFAALMISLSVEFTQTLVPGQLFDVDALLLNTVGVALTHLLVVPAARRRLRLRETAAPAAGAEREDAARADAARDDTARDDVAHARGRTRNTAKAKVR
jgi:glycopeptide antibiotics resistance protein